MTSPAAAPGASTDPAVAPGALAVPESDRCQVMGIVNVTPDSFSDGGRFRRAEAAVEHALRLVSDGADLVDIGGESTRPGAVRVSEDEEMRRVMPVVDGLARAGVRVSIDTMRARVAAAAVDAGAVMVNDVSGGLADPDMLPFLADAGVPCVLMHWRAHAEVMAQWATYDSVVDEVRSELAQRCDAALSAGVRHDRIVLDPGIGFAKTVEHCWSVMAALPRLLTLGYPVLVGASRKRFLAECVDYGALDGAQPEHRDDVSATAATLAMAAGVWGVRVHTVAGAAAASRYLRRLRAAAPQAVDDVQPRAVARTLPEVM